MVQEILRPLPDPETSQTFAHLEILCSLSFSFTSPFGVHAPSRGLEILLHQTPSMAKRWKSQSGLYMEFCGLFTLHLFSAPVHMDVTANATCHSVKGLYCWTKMQVFPENGIPVSVPLLHKKLTSTESELLAHLHQPCLLCKFFPSTQYIASTVPVQK